MCAVRNSTNSCRHRGEVRVAVSGEHVRLVSKRPAPGTLIVSECGTVSQAVSARAKQRFRESAKTMGVFGSDPFQAPVGGRNKRAREGAKACCSR